MNNLNQGKKPEMSKLFEVTIIEMNLFLSFDNPFIKGIG